MGGGAALALVAGIMLGGAMQPNLNEDFTGPQTLIPGSGQRDAASDGGANIASYGAQLPDYVIGTDWTRPRELALTSTPVEAPNEEAPEITIYATDASGQEPMKVVRTTWRDAAHDPVVYPSDRGGVIYETDLPAPPPAPDAQATYPGEGDPG